MVEVLTTFADLDEPDTFMTARAGWYVACSTDEHDGYYLHDNGKIYDTCDPRWDEAGNYSTGWFTTQLEAYIQSGIYYNSHGLAYPYADKIQRAVPANNNTEPQVMDFI